MNKELIDTYRTKFLHFLVMALLKLDGTMLEAAPYIKVLVSDAMDFAEGKVKRHVVNLPPRHGKTKIFSICLAAWMLGRNPSAKIMIISYSSELAETISK